MVYVSAFSVSMLVLFLVIFCFVFVLLLSCFLFCFQSMKNIFCFFELCWLKTSLFLCFCVFVFAVLFLVLFVCSLNNEVALFCVCVVCFLTMWFSRLHLVVLFFVLCSFFVFIPFKKDPTKTGHKNPKTKMQKKWTNKNSVSAVVVTNRVPNLLGVGYKLQFSLKTL